MTLSAILDRCFRSISSIGVFEMPVSLLILEADFLIVAADLLFRRRCFCGRQRHLATGKGL
ncbi:hypothetical protein NGR_c14810 [Sinorhizobium fredii NGR234]|uniref:Uncharacterized protein n=1 Tax=Sinorhizobium fredii (strain NBRC 101917 / NGR234) TaxID=394 RepID=C3MCH4_SINFN|nr:hypothetical protein NGR_c14810 [Sinorhizobium fredii NGR234]